MATEKSQVFDLAEDDNSYACAWLFVLWWGGFGKCMFCCFLWVSKTRWLQRQILFHLGLWRANQTLFSCLSWLIQVKYRSAAGQPDCPGCSSCCERTMMEPLPRYLALVIACATSHVASPIGLCFVSRVQMFHSFSSKKICRRGWPSLWPRSFWPGSPGRSSVQSAGSSRYFRWGVELAGAALCGLSNDPFCLHAGRPEKPGKACCWPEPVRQRPTNCT